MPTFKSVGHKKVPVPNVRSENKIPLGRDAEPRHHDVIAQTVNESAGKRSLLEAAAIEFSERGFDGASVLAIAKRAGVKQPLLNYHFGSKDLLWRAVIEEGYRETTHLENTLDSHRVGVDPLSRLTRLLDSFARMNIKRPSVHAIMQKELILDSSRRDWLVDNFMQPFNKHLNSLIEECVAHGVLRPFPVEQISVMLTGILISYVIASEMPERMYGPSFKTTEASHSYFENALDAMLNGILTDSARKMADTAVNPTGSCRE